MLDSPGSYRTMTEGDYPALFQMDTAVYPTTNPVTTEVVNGWYQRNPEFGIVFPGEKPNSIRGMLAIIPLSRLGSQKLISGRLSEADMKEKMIFNQGEDNNLWLHNYHIEGGPKGFYREALNALGATVKRLGPDVNLLGFSAFAVSPSGIGLHEVKFNMHEGEFISQEYVVEKPGKPLMVIKINRDEAGKMMAQGIVVRRCKMLITIPGETSIVWDYLNLNR